MASRTSETLYPLLFGTPNRVLTRSILQMQDQMQRAMGWAAEYDAIGERAAFATQQSSLVINGLRISALAHTPIRTRVDSDEFSFFMPVDGGPIQSQVNGESIRCEPAKAALLAPEGERIGIGGSRSIVVATLDKLRLVATARTMLGGDDVRLDLQRPTVIPLSAGKMNFNLLLRSSCSALDACRMNGQAAAAMALDDVFYRTLCAMLLHERLFPEEARSPGASVDGGLDLACQYIVAHLAERLSMTDLEQISGLSARALQYAFQRRFGCTPVTWIRNERLNAARERLLAAGEQATVTDVALAFGFSNLGNFSKYYSDKFGEYPSQTLSSARGKP